MILTENIFYFIIKLYYYIKYMVNNCNYYKIISKNNKVNLNFTIEDKIEAGVELQGWEVKSIRMYGVSLFSTYCSIYNGECWWKEASLKNPIEKGRIIKNRKLLLNKRQIYKWYGLLSKKNKTIIPLECYFKNKKYFKIVLGLCSRNKKYEKKQILKEKEMLKFFRKEIY